MKNKYKLLLIISIAFILPSVAVADVMVTGSVLVSGTQSVAPVHFETGMNYAKAHDLGALTWKPSSGGLMGTIDLEGSENSSITLANVLDLNTSAESVNGAIVYLNLSSTSFPAGTLYVTNSPMTISEVQSGSFTSGQLVGSLALDTTGSIHFTVENPTTTPLHMVLYIGFELPPGNYSGNGFTLYVQYTATGAGDSQ
ncbi:MAG: hypothetical protein ACYDCP_08500 [Thermoplasmataceae archaeon]